MRWYTIVVAMLIYAIIGWVLMAMVGETGLLDPVDYVYWLMVTGSTVGYGDMSPQTPAGKTLVAFYMIPIGLSLFALVIGRAASWVSMQWQKGVKGLKTLNVSDHILVIGWNEQRTLHLLNLLLKEKDAAPGKPDIVLCVRADIENPMPGDIGFVRVNTFSQDDEMDRAGVSTARVIILDNPEDDLTMTTALYCSKRNPDAHKIAYFKDENLVPLLQEHCPNVECTPSVAVEMLAKSAFDPGSSLLHHDLLSVQEGQAQFSVVLPHDSQPIPARQLFMGFKTVYDATFIGFANDNSKQHVNLNPALDSDVQPGDSIFYIAPQRLGAIDWQQLREL
ncbi:potassium channel protein [Fluctibacter halophilus]